MSDINKDTNNKQKSILVTGAAGFIGFHLSMCLLDKGYRVIGLDNLNDYYSVSLKEYRLGILSKKKGGEDFIFEKKDLADKTAIMECFERFKPEIVVNLAAQAGVRYCIENPDAYISSNIIGFYNILEACRHYQPEHLLFASSSSVYGGNDKIPFSTKDKVDKPLSLYAATKKSNELMAYSYSNLFGVPSTGLRFFTVYGPMGRPDMACYKFALNIMNDRPIQVYNNGDMYRDFTYIDDIVAGICSLLESPPSEDEAGVRFKVYNIGNNNTEKLMDFISILEKGLGREAKKEFLPMQPGDVHKTYADIDELAEDFGFRPRVRIEEGLKHFTDWFKEYHKDLFE